MRARAYIGASVAALFAAFAGCTFDEAGSALSDASAASRDVTGAEAIAGEGGVDGAADGGNVDAPADGGLDGAFDGGSDGGTPADGSNERVGDASAETQPADTNVDTVSADTSVDTVSADTSVDTVSADTSVDTVSADTSVDTAPPADSSVDTSRDQGTVQTCSQKYGAVPGFKLCGETKNACLFYFDPPSSSRSCNAMCAIGGGTCIAAAAEQNNSCTPSYQTLCSVTHGDGLCTCTR